MQQVQALWRPSGFMQKCNHHAAVRRGVAAQSWRDAGARAGDHLPRTSVPDPQGLFGLGSCLHPAATRTNGGTHQTFRPLSLVAAPDCASPAAAANAYCRSAVLLLLLFLGLGWAVQTCSCRTNP